MSDPRITRLAELLVDHSCKLRAGQKVLIEAFDLPRPELVCALVEKVAQRGAVPVINLKDNEILRMQYLYATEEAMTLQGELEAHSMSQMDAYIGIRGASNSSEFSDVPQEIQETQVRGPIRIIDQQRGVVRRLKIEQTSQLALHRLNVCLENLARQ